MLASALDVFVVIDVVDAFHGRGAINALDVID